MPGIVPTWAGGPVAVAGADHERLRRDDPAEATLGRALLVVVERVRVLHALHPAPDVGRGDGLLQLARRRAARRSSGRRRTHRGWSSSSSSVAGVRIGPGVLDQRDQLQVADLRVAPGHRTAVAKRSTCSAPCTTRPGRARNAWMSACSCRRRRWRDARDDDLVDGRRRCRVRGRFTGWAGRAALELGGRHVGPGGSIISCAAREVDEASRVDEPVDGAEEAVGVEQLVRRAAEVAAHQGRTLYGRSPSVRSQRRPGLDRRCALVARQQAADLRVGFPRRVERWPTKKVQVRQAIADGHVPRRVALHGGGGRRPTS